MQCERLRAERETLALDETQHYCSEERPLLHCAKRRSELDARCPRDDRNALAI
jgi:hypothetical protein